ncbi:MAG TPA: hypothetical protein VFI06_09115 [Chitinophagaceae bacterium]|nr:hypothetical protein [Chitinophagaceae bacterium]
MKVIFLSVAVAAFSFASAQDNQQSPKSKFNLEQAPRFYLVNPPQPQIVPNARLLNTLPNGNKVYALPQDKMPCVVPDITNYNMPVVKPDVTYTIPNPALPSPPTNKPAILSEEQFKKLLELQQQQHK